MRIDLHDTPFEGVSRSTSTLQTACRWPHCKRCGSSLAGRHESTAPRRIRGAPYVVDVFRCSCGRGREVRRPM
jgi:hypothetical protein